MLNWQTQTTLSVKAEATSHLTTSDYLGMRASCQEVNFPDSQLRVAEHWLFFDGHRRMSDFAGSSQREGGNWGKKNQEKACHVLHSPHYQQKEVCAIIIHLSPFPLQYTFFSTSSSSSSLAEAGAAPTTQALSDWGLRPMEILGMGNDIWLSDSQA